MKPAPLVQLVEQLVAARVIEDAAAARYRIRLGYPVWMVLSELEPGRLLQELSAASGLPLLGVAISDVGLDMKVLEESDPDWLKERRWLPLANGSIAIADPFGLLPDGALEGRPLCLAAYTEIDDAFVRQFPNLAGAGRRRRRLGRYLLEAGAVTEEALAEALQEQQESGGLLGEILVAQGKVEPSVMASALAARVGLQPPEDGMRAAPLLPRDVAHELRAVAIASEDVAAQTQRPTDEPVRVAFSDPSDEKTAEVSRLIGAPVMAVVVDNETLDTLLASVYAELDVEDAVNDLRHQTPEFSAYRTSLSRPQLVGAIAAVVLLVVGLILDVRLTIIVLIALGTAAYLGYSAYRLYGAWRGWMRDSTIDPSADDLLALDGRQLPRYTVLLPVFREKPQTLQALFDALSQLDYPKHKLNGLLLVESDDTQTQEALAQLAALRVDGRPLRPAWLKTLLIPPGGPRTKPKAMIYGLLYASGELLTIFDAEDKPEPDQLKKAAWAFSHTKEKVACIQAKLSYYNSRQNLLTRWFTLEYAAWFEMFLPGLHAMGAPIPLGGTSNHFRIDILKDVLSWDPYNVTEDADLGLRFTRAGYRTLMLESTTFEEANSRVGNWLRQRSRWIKGYMQTFLVHTRQPVQLYRELGFVNMLHFVATVGGLIFTVVVSPVFWALLAIWLVAQPAWIPEIFPGPVYYLAMISLIFGNFLFVFLALAGATGRGQDDLAPYTLIFPLYWLMMSVASYIALYELITKPHYWQKTEHGLHLETAPEPEVQT